MMKIRLILILLFLSTFRCSADEPTDKYLDGIKKVFADCVMNYNMVCEYPNSEKIKIKGVIGVKGENYYDSSNFRFVFLNDKWYLSADHQEKQLSVAYVPDLNKKLKDIGSFSVSNFLFTGDEFYSKLKVKIISEDKETVLIKLVLPENNLVESLQIKMYKDSYVPISYTTKVRYPLKGYGDENLYVNLNINCYKVTYPAPKSLFNHNRLLTLSADKKVELKKFKSYKYF